MSVKQWILLCVNWHLRKNLICKQIKLSILVEGDLRACFSITTTPWCGESATPFPALLHFTLDPYLVMLSVKQGGIEYHFLSLWYDPTWD